MPVRVLAAVLLVAACAAEAQPAAPAAEPIGDVVADADGDGVPDRVGARVVVSGVAPVAEGTYGEFGAGLYVQDATGGLAVEPGRAHEPRRRVRAGDQLVVAGTLAFYAGVAVVEADEIERVGRVAVPPPAPYRPEAPDAVEGQLVRAEGTVVGKSQVDVGQALLLSLDDLSLVVVFAFKGQPGAVSYDGLDAGDRVRVVGVAGQYDRAAPYVDSRQIYPRAQADLRGVGLPSWLYKRVALGAVVVLAGALALVVALRVQVRRRVAALRESEDRYETLVERASDAVLVHDLRGAVRHANRAARRALGLADGVPPPPLLDLVAPADRAAVREHLAQVARTGNARLDIRLGTGGREFEVESQSVEVGGGQQVLSLARDVSARRDYERGLIEAREQAEEAARAKSAFLASMSHEIRTPLTAVIGFAELLHHEVDREHHDLVRAIMTGGKRLLATLNSVLDVASLDARRHTLRPSPVDLAAEVAEAVDLLRPLALERGLALDVALPPEPVPALLDAGALDRIVTNLVGNAIKFTPQGAVTVGVERRGGSAVVWVEDTGVGIPEAFLPDLFTEFRQQSEGFGRSHEGTGLGLAITKRLVELMGGEIHVWSREGEGTRFEVTLPVVAPPCPAAAAPDDPPAGRPAVRTAEEPDPPAPPRPPAPAAAPAAAEAASAPGTAVSSL